MLTLPLRNNNIIDDPVDVDLGATPSTRLSQQTRNDSEDLGASKLITVAVRVHGSNRVAAGSPLAPNSGLRGPRGPKVSSQSLK